MSGPMRLVAVVVAVVALTTLSVAAFAAFAAFSDRTSTSLTTAACRPASTARTVVDVTLADRGAMSSPGMMGRGGMLSLSASPDTVPAGRITFIATNVGALDHELVIMHLPADGAGTRPVGSDGTVDESGSLGEASTSCGSGAGDGITPGTRSWVTLDLPAGHYELLCDLPWHYAGGMFTAFTVT